MGEEDDSSIRSVKRSELIRIINARVEETFALIALRLKALGLDNQPNHRIVLTGGCSYLEGIRDVASLILNKQVRLGLPRNINNIPDKLNSPIFSTALGMLLFATNNTERKPKKMTNAPEQSKSYFGKIFNWIRQNS